MQIRLLTLRPEDIRAAATALRCSRAAVEAVIAVEASGSGFLDDGRPKILFEAHHFDRLTGGRFRADHPDLSAPTWSAARAHYVGGAGEWDRLVRAMGLDAIAGMAAASWGAFQIMGFNYDLCGFGSVERFVEAHKRSARDHLDAFVQYVVARGLDTHLAGLDWTAFARGYNGPGYAEHRYHERLAEAYAIASDEWPDNPPALRPGASGHWVRAAQRRLAATLDPGDAPAADGVFGPATRRAVRVFQDDCDLAVDGIVGPRTWAALRASA